MRFSDLRFEPHRHNRLGRAGAADKTHARATLPNGETVSVVHWPSQGFGPDDAPFEILTARDPGEDGEGFTYAHSAAEVDALLARVAV